MKRLLMLLGGLMSIPAFATVIEPVITNNQQINYGSSISPDGKTLYFTDAGTDFSDRNIMQAQLEGTKVSNRSAVLFAGNPLIGGDTQISPDGNTLLFYSREAIKRDAARKDGDLFYARKTPSGWSAPERFPEQINTEQNEFYPVLTHSGNLYFARENQDTSYDIYVSRLTPDGYQLAEKLGDNINTDLLESDAYVSPDESFMVFVRMFEEGAQGVSDLYITFNQDGDWCEARNLGADINFAGVDGSPFVTQDKKWLYFTSNRDAPDPEKFDTYLGVYRVPFSTVHGHAYSSIVDNAKVYGDVTTATPFYEQGQVIFNTSMPDTGASHYFTDNSGFEWGPTAIYQRQRQQPPKRIELKNARIPADVHITPKGDELYFADYGDDPSRVYKAHKENGQWQSPVLEPRLPAGSGYLTSTRQGVIYFFKDKDIYRLEGEKLTKLPATINSDEGEFDPFIAQDESFLIFVRQDAQGDSNMYLSINSQNGWSKAEKLPSPYNDNKVDGSPYVTPDRRYLFWSSNRNDDVLRTWQAPIYHYLLEKLQVSS